MAIENVANPSSEVNPPAVFRFEDGGVKHQVRTVVIDGEPWFYASDVASALGYAKPANAVKQHCKNSKSLITLTTLDWGSLVNQGLSPNALLIPESDVYRLVTVSILPSAERFKDWLYEKVLPSISKTGSYSIQQDPPELAYMIGDIEADALPTSLAHFAMLPGAFSECIVLGSRMGISDVECAAVSVLLARHRANTTIEGEYCSAPARKSESRDITTVEGETLLPNAKLAKRIGIKASSSDGASITNLLYRAGLITKPRGRTLTPIGSKFGRIVHADGGTHLCWLDPDTAKYLVEWRKKNAW